MKETQKEDSGGVKTSVNKNGQLEIEVDLFEEEFEKQFNGTYIFDRPKFKHRDVVTRILKAMQTTESWQDVAQTIAKARGIQVRYIPELLEKGELTEEEEEMFNSVTEKGMDIEKLYGFAPGLLSAISISGPEGVNVSTTEDFDELPIGLGRILFEHGLNWVVDKFSLSEGRRKK